MLVGLDRCLLIKCLVNSAVVAVRVALSGKAYFAERPEMTKYSKTRKNKPVY